MNRIVALLNLLKDKQNHTHQELAVKLKVSKRTVFSDLNKLNDDLCDHGAEIISKPHYGVSLRVHDKEKYNAYRKELVEDTINDTTSSTDSRTIQIAQLLITSKEAIKQEDISNQLYISTSTLKNDLKKVKELLKQYDLSIHSSAYKGTWIEGSENNIRKCLTAINKKMYGESGRFFNKDINQISEIIKNILNENAYRMPEYLFNNLVVHFYIAIMRIRFGYSLENAKGYDRYIEKEDELLAKQIIFAMEESFHVSFPQSEYGYVILLLKSRKLAENNTVIPKEIYEVIMEMLEEIDQMFHYDFRYDFELISLLALHLMSLEVRLIYDMTLDNPLIEEIREGALLAFEMANVACSKLSKHYNKSVTSDEMAYIALHFHLAIERSQDNHKKNILIVCGTGRGSSEVVAYSIKKDYGDYLNIVDTHESSDFSDVDFSKYDYVLTTIHIEQPLPLPVFEIDMIRRKENREKLDKYFLYDNQSELLQYFDKELFIGDIKANDKTDVIKRLCDTAVKKQLVSKEFYEHVLKREELGVTAFGNRIAIPHPYRPEGDVSFVVTGILNHPIQWDGEEVQVVFLLSMKRDGDKNLQLFYKSVGQLLANKEAVDQLIKHKDFKTLISILDQLQK